MFLFWLEVNTYSGMLIVEVIFTVLVTNISNTQCKWAHTRCYFLKHRPPWPMLSISWFVHTFVCLCVCVFTFEVPFKRLFAPTSQSRMSKLFRSLESLGKSNGQKWSHIWKLLLIKGVKSPRNKRFVLGRILQGSGGYTTRIRRLYNKDEEVIQQGSWSY